MSQPLLPPDEAPLSRAQVQRMLKSMGGDMVLVGGQALAYWMDRYNIRGDGEYVTTDADAIGTLREARSLAERLHGTLKIPPPTALTGLVAQLRLPSGDGRVGNVDVLHLLYTAGGLKKCVEFTRRVVARSVKVRIEGGIEFRVMNPIDMLDSRIQNAAGLREDKGDHVVTQARWAIEVVRAVLFKLARDGHSSDMADRRLGSAIADIFRLAGSQAGRQVWKDLGIDVYSVIPVDHLLALSPAHALQLQKARKAQDARAAAA